MSKFVSTYGDVIIIVLVVLMLIAIVTPIGDTIKNGITTWIQNFSDQAQNMEFPKETLSNMLRLR